MTDGISDTDRQEAMERISEKARSFFEARDEHERARMALITEIVRGKEQYGLGQIRMRNCCDLRIELEKRILADNENRGGEGGDWTFHRTRIQQWLREARETAAVVVRLRAKAPG